MNLPDVMDKIGGLADLDDELQELLPYVQTCIKAYRWIRKKRIVHFLRTLNHALTQWDEKARKKFEEYVFSNIGQELLADYSDTVLLTASRISQSALALLYADIEHLEFAASFKKLASTSLRGCSDQLVELFIQLIELPLEEREEVPYPVRFIKRGDLGRFTSLQSYVETEEEVIVLTNDLIQRGILLPDHTSGRFSDREGNWFFVFGISTTTTTFLRLLKKARGMLEEDSQPSSTPDSE